MSKYVVSLNQYDYSCLLYFFMSIRYYTHIAPESHRPATPYPSGPFLTIRPKEIRNYRTNHQNGCGRGSEFSPCANRLLLKSVKHL